VEEEDSRGVISKKRMSISTGKGDGGFYCWRF
jgi:hypothetical protein